MVFVLTEWNSDDSQCFFKGFHKIIKKTKIFGFQKPLQKRAEPMEETVTPSQEELDFANRPRPRREARFRRVFLEDPFLTGKMVDSVSLRQLDPVSPSGE